MGLTHLPAAVPNPGPALPGRPAFPVLASMLGAFLRASPLRMAELLPAVMAAAAGLGLGASVRVVLGRPRGQMLAVAMGVGTSAFLVHAINVEGYQDNMIAIAILAAAVTAVLLAVQHRRAMVAGVILVGACAAAHWNVFGVVAATLVLAALFLLPWSVGGGRTWGQVFIDSPAGRLVLITIGGAALAAGWLAGLLTAALPRPRLDEAQFVFKAHRDVPAYHLEVTLPFAAGGALSLAAADGGQEPNSVRTRAFLALMLAWCQVTLLFFVWGWIFGKPVPTHRVLAMCLALPALAVLGLLWVADRAFRHRRVLAAALVIAGLAGSAVLAQRTWLGYRPVMDPGIVAEAETAARYLSSAKVPVDRPVVFVVDDRSAFAWSNVWLLSHTIRAGLPSSRVTHAYFYVGRPEDYLAHRPTDLRAGSDARISASRYQALSASYFGAMASTYPRHPVALLLHSTNAAYGEWTGARPESSVAEGVAIVRGPRPGSNPSPVPPSEPLGFLELIGLGMGALTLLAAIGAGWTLFLLGDWLGSVEVAALAPGVGSAACVLGGVASAAAGLPLTGPGAFLGAVGLAATGWLAGLRRQRRTAPPRE